MEAWELAQELCHYWHRIMIEEGVLLSDVPFSDLRASYRSKIYKEALKRVSSRKYAPFIIETNSRKIRVW